MGTMDTTILRCFENGTSILILDILLQTPLLDSSLVHLLRRMKALTP